MPTSVSFAPFARQLTRGYVVLAIVLILVVVGTTSALAFILYVSALNDATGELAQRLSTHAAAYGAQHQSLATYAPRLVAENSRRLRVAVYDDEHHLLAGSGSASTGRFSRALGALLGLHPSVVRVTGGSIVVVPDFTAFVALLGRYLAVVLPIGALAVVAAWLVGRRITGRAVGPLQDVTQALQRIAGGDFTPQPLLANDQELRDLTDAYNDVARRLTAATAQRERDELQMRQFIADAGHELRTPLTIVMGYLEILQKGLVREPDKVADLQATMLGESRRMRASIDKLILLARLERGAAIRTSAVDVNAVVTRVASALEPLAGTGRIVVETAPNSAITRADESELYEAIKNVVENAVRYAPESPVYLSVNAASDVTVTITDRGPGMDEGDVAHAFDRFYRGSARGEAEGSGLGLAIAKRAVERVGGAVALESRVGEGTRVTLTLPAHRR